MLRTTLGSLLINEVLPEEFRRYDRVFDSKTTTALLEEIAKKYPERYGEILKKLGDLGREFAYFSGGQSVSIDDLKPAVSARRIRYALARDIRKIQQSKLPPEEKDKRIVLAVGRYMDQMRKEVLEESLAEDNPLARQVVGTGRGNALHVSSLRGSDMLYTDHRDNPVPIPILRNYSEGLTPLEYYAGSFGARKGMFDLALATQNAGAFGKQLIQATHRLLVSAVDDDTPYDETNPRGYEVDTDDPDNEGAFLAHPVGGYPRNTELTPKILKDLRDRGFDKILVRSPIVGGPADGGVFAYDVGKREGGRLEPVGSFSGITAATGLAEPVTQGAISSKHAGGVAGSHASGAVSGFKLLSNLAQVPKHFPGAAAHARLDGYVTSVEKAPQGGHFVTIDGDKHYVAHGYEVRVKKGDRVEAGDMLSDGIPNPAEIVKYKGIGEGRVYFIRTFREALKNMGTPGHRRNIELLARGLINNVRLTDELGDWGPDDVLPYHLLERQWQPREGHATLSPNHAVGKYLERPVLHYTIGTKIRPSMLPVLAKYKIKEVVVHSDPPPWEPEMIRAMEVVSHDPDWMTRMLGSYQERSLLNAVHRGAVSDELGTSYVPALARGVLFGRAGKTQGVKPEGNAPSITSIQQAPQMPKPTALSPQPAKPAAPAKKPVVSGWRKYIAL